MELLAQSGNFLFRYAQRLITDICLSQTLLTVEAETFSITKMTLEANTNGTEAQQATINPEEQPSGRCLCGKTSYKITKLDERSPGQILVCHCSLCRRGSGALCVPFAAFPRQYVKFDEDSFLRRSRVTEVAERLFCVGCGSQVGMDYGMDLEPDTLWLTLGLGLCDDSEFNKHIGTKKIRQNQIAKARDPNDAAASLTKEQGSFPGVRSKCSRIFRESRAEIHDAIEGLPGMEHFGSWVPNPCSPDPPVDNTWQDDMR